MRGTVSIVLVLFFALASLVSSVSKNSRNEVWSKQCGSEMKSERKGGGRIVGGQRVNGYRYPWFASLQLPMMNHPVCGGALIAPNFIVTAAHCFDVAPVEKHATTYQVILGVVNQCAKSEKQRRKIPVKRVILHDEYKPRGKFFDIALIELSEAAINFTTICMPKPFTHPTSKFGVVLGMGVTKSGGEQPCELQELDIRIFSSRECIKSRLPLSVVKEKTILCAGYLEGNKDSCQGDSGGPLMVMGEDGRWVLRGIVSFGYGCAREGLPGVYTSVAHYIDWIQTKTGLFANETLIES